MLSEILLFISFFGIIYSYALYPLLLLIIPGRPSNTGKQLQAARVALITTVHNEEKRIDEKLENTLTLDYPPELLDIIIASDCSTDRTHDIVAGYADKGVRLVVAGEHLGKEYAQSCAIAATDADIIVFSDVATTIRQNSIHQIVDAFADANIGAVSSEDRFLAEDGQLVGEGAYIKYEMWLRALESRRAGLIGLSGSFFAARRSICDQWDIQSPSDFNTALNCARHNLLAISCPDIHGYYPDLKDPKKEFNRKLRTVIRGITALSRNTEFLNPLRYGVFSLQLWSHKVMRWLVPWFMLSFLILSIALYSKSPLYSSLVWLQVITYSGYGVFRIKATGPPPGILRIAYFFIDVNLAIAYASIQFVGGKRMTTWSPTQR